MRSEGVFSGGPITMGASSKCGVKSKNDRVIEQVLQIQRDIDKFWNSREVGAAVRVQKALVYLGRLNNMEITWDILEKTGIGQTVGNIRNECHNITVKEKGKRLIRKWKALDPKAILMRRSVPEVDANELNQERKTSRSGDIRDYNQLSFKPPAVHDSDSDKKSDKEDGSPNDGDQEPYEEQEWTVRYSPDTKVGLKLIFAKMKPYEKVKALCSNRHSRLNSDEFAEI